MLTKIIAASHVQYAMKQKMLKFWFTNGKLVIAIAGSSMKSTESSWFALACLTRTFAVYEECMKACVNTPTRLKIMSMVHFGTMQRLNLSQVHFASCTRQDTHLVHVPLFAKLTAR